jgi:hypothetical protein
MSELGPAAGTPRRSRPLWSQQLVVPGGEPPPPRRFLPDAADIREVARIAQQLATVAEIPYRYGPTRRILRVFPGEWWDSEIRRDHEGERGPRP